MDLCRKHRGELAARSPRKSRDSRRISLPWAAVENTAEMKLVSIRARLITLIRV